jgi:hypothetical protein
MMMCDVLVCCSLRVRLLGTSSGQTVVPRVDIVIILNMNSEFKVPYHTSTRMNRSVLVRARARHIHPSFQWVVTQRRRQF